MWSPACWEAFLEKLYCQHFSSLGLYPRTPPSLFCHLTRGGAIRKKHLTLKTKRRARGDSVCSPHLWPTFITSSAMLELGILHSNDHFTKECFILLIKCLLKCNLLWKQSTNLLFLVFVKQSFLLHSQVPAVMSSKAHLLIMLAYSQFLSTPFASS